MNYWIYFRPFEPIPGERVVIRECPICHAWVIKHLDNCPNCDTILLHPTKEEKNQCP